MKAASLAIAVLALVAPNIASAQRAMRGAPTSAERPARAADGWTGTWSAASLDLNGANLADFGGKTVRQTVRISIGGTSARIRLSNRFGTTAVKIGDIRLAQAGSDRDTVAGTDLRVTFGGARSVTLQPGQEVVSDALAATFAPNSDVAVSMYFPQSIDRTHITAHRQAWQVVYFASGNVAGATSITPVATADNLFFLTGIDVVNTQAAGAVVALGASITDSSNSSFGANKRWTNLLSQRLQAAGLTVGVLNAGLSGNGLLSDGEFGGPSAFNRFQHDVLDQPNVKWVIFSDDPINDLSGRSTPDVQPLSSFTTLLTKMTAAAHQKGVRFYCSTLTPNKGRAPEAWSDGAEAVRQQLNAFIRTPESGCDGVVDQDTATHDPQDPLRFRPAFNAGDSLHPNDAGMAAIADSVNLGFFTASGVPPIAPPPADSASCGMIFPGQGLRTGQSIRSCDGRFTATVSGDGRLVVSQGTTVLGGTDTAGSGATAVTLLADGSFALFDDIGRIVWSTQTAGLLGNVVLMQNDGNLVLYDRDAVPFWASNTFGR